MYLLFAYIGMRRRAPAYTPFFYFIEVYQPMAASWSSLDGNFQLARSIEAESKGN